MGTAQGPLYRVAFRRRRENRTNYTKRLAMIKATTPRLVVRKSAQGVLVQFIAFDEKGDRTLAAANSSELEAHGWMPQSNAPSAYLTGMLAGARAKKAGVKGFHLDIGMATPTKGSILMAGALGAKQAGLSAEMDEKIVDAKRLDGSHIADYAKKMRADDGAKYSKHFSRYIKKNVDPTALPALFGSVKSKVLSG